MVITIDHESYHSHSISHNYPNKTLLPLCAVLYCICMLCVMPVATSQKTFPVVPLALGLNKSRMELWLNIVQPYHQMFREKKIIHIYSIIYLYN